jgi:hypothetical protein
MEDRKLNMEKGKRKDDQRQLAEEIIIVVDSRVRIIPTYIAGAAHESYIVLLDDGEFVYDWIMLRVVSSAT